MTNDLQDSIMLEQIEIHDVREVMFHLRPSEKSVYYWLSELISECDCNSVEISYSGLRGICGLGRDTVVRAVNKLEEKGLITTTPGSRSSGGSINVYTLVKPVMHMHIDQKCMDRASKAIWLFDKTVDRQ